MLGQPEDWAGDRVFRSVTAPNDREMELGWQAYALSLIQSEIDDEEQGANRTFLHDVSNLNFVQTPQGKLGDLLKRGRCKLGDPVGVDYVPKVQGIEQGDFFRLQLSVDCNIPGPTYFSRPLRSSREQKLDGKRSGKREQD